MLNDFPGHLLQRQVSGGKAAGFIRLQIIELPGSSQQFRHVGTGNIHSVGAERCIMQDLLELGIISGPVVTCEHFEGGRFKTEDLPAQFHVQIGKIQAGQSGNFIPTAAEGWRIKDQRGKPGIQFPGKGMLRPAVNRFTGKDQPESSGHAGFLDHGKQRLLVFR